MKLNWLPMTWEQDAAPGAAETMEAPVEKTDAAPAVEPAAKEPVTDPKPETKADAAPEDKAPPAEDAPKGDTKDAPEAAKEDSPASAIPDDWRKLAATGADGKVDPDLEKFLAESGSLAELAKRAHGLRKAQSKGPQKLEHPGGKATEEELNAYYEAAGVPKDPGDYTAKLELPDFLNNDEGRAAVTKEFAPLAEIAQRKGIDAETFNEMAKVWFDDRAAQQEQQALNDKSGPQMLEKAMLERGYSKTDYNTGMAAITEWGVQAFGEDEFDAILEMRTADGSRFGSTPEFFEAFVKPARDTFGETLSLMTGGAPSKEKADARYDALMKEYGQLSREGRVGEWPNDKQEELEQLSRLRQGQKRFQAA